MTMKREIRRTLVKRSITSAAFAALAGALTSTRRSRAQASGRIGGFDHVAVPMRKTELMIRFYRNLELPVVEGERICSVHFGDHKINFHRAELWQDESFTLRAPAAEPPCGDFCFVWEGTSESLESTLKRAGATIELGPVDRKGGRNGGTASGVSWYTRDPDGNLLEFIIY